MDTATRVAGGTGMTCWSGCAAAETTCEGRRKCPDDYSRWTWRRKGKRKRKEKTKSNRPQTRTSIKSSQSWVSTVTQNRGRACTEQGGVRDWRWRREGGKGGGCKNQLGGKTQGSQRGGTAPSGLTVHLKLDTVRDSPHALQPFTSVLRP